MAMGPEGTPIRIIGSYLSSCVRKVLAVLELKGLRYEIDPIVPFMGDVFIWGLFNEAVIGPGVTRLP